MTTRRLSGLAPCAIVAVARCSTLPCVSAAEQARHKAKAEAICNAEKKTEIYRLKDSIAENCG